MLNSCPEAEVINPLLFKSIFCHTAFRMIVPPKIDRIPMNPNPIITGMSNIYPALRIKTDAKRYTPTAIKMFPNIFI